MERINNIYWIVWLTCSGKSTVASRIAKETWYQNFKLDHIYRMAWQKMWVSEELSREERHKQLMELFLNDNLDVIKECYKEYFSEANKENIIVEWVMPFDREWELEIILDIFKWKKINVIFLEPEYKKWLSYRKLRQLNWDLFPVELSKDEYDQKNSNLYKTIKTFSNSIVSFINPDSVWAVTSMVLPYQHKWFTDVKFKQLDLWDLSWKVVLDLWCNKWLISKLCLESWANKAIWVDCSARDLEDAKDRWVDTILYDLNNIEWLYIQDQVDIVLAISVMHYIKNVDKFIKKCHSIAKEMFLFEWPITPEIKYCLIKYFKEVEFCWNSIVQDNSVREIYKCYK